MDDARPESPGTRAQPSPDSPLAARARPAEGGKRSRLGDPIENAEPRLEPPSKAAVVAPFHKPVDRVGEQEDHAERNDEGEAATPCGVDSVDHDVADILVDEVERIGQRSEEDRGSTAEPEP